MQYHFSDTLEESVTRNVLLNTFTIHARDSTCTKYAPYKGYIEYGATPNYRLVSSTTYEKLSFYNCFWYLPLTVTQKASFKIGENDEYQNMSIHYSPAERFYFQIDTTSNLDSVFISFGGCEFKVFIDTLKVLSQATR